MGCAGSTNMVPATSDISLKPTIAPTSSSIPQGELILKDLPDVVEKVIDTLKESDSKQPHVESTEIPNTSDIKEDTSSADTSADKNSQHTNSKYTTTTQAVLMDSTSSSSKQSELEQLEEYNKFKNKNSPTNSFDIDSLRTSSPESEIEQALANNSEQNPPTPKPTFSELQNLVVGPVNTMIKSYVKTSEQIITEIGEKNPAFDNSDKSEENNITSVIRIDTTDWEKQADMLALTQKFNPIEAIRKLKRENGVASSGERNGSGLILRNEFNSHTQNFFEDLNEFLPLQSPIRSILSSPISERSLKVITSELDDSGRQSLKTENEDNKKPKVKEVKLKKSPNRKTKDPYLIVPTNVRGVPSPSPHKVRERCSVCCNKYKH